MKFPNIININKDINTPNQIDIKLDIKPEIIYFAGHFESHPVLPGVVQLDWVLHFAKSYLNINKTNEGTLADLVGSFHMLIPYVLATIITLIIVLFVASPGIILLLASISLDWEATIALEWIDQSSMLIPALLIIVPVVYVSIRLQYYDYFLIDTECSVLESIKNSARITKGYAAELFLLGISLTIIVLISIIPLGAGLIISIPLGIMVNTYTYTKLKTNLKTN